VAGSHGKRAKLGELLVEAGLIGKTQLAAALGEQRRWGNRLGLTLVRMGFLEEEDLVRALAVQLGLPVARIRGKRIEPEALELVPAELADKHRCLPLFVREEGGARVLHLAMEDPVDLATIDALCFQLGVEIRPVLAAPTELEDAMHRHYHWATMGGGEPPAPRPVDADERPELLAVRRLGAEPEPVAATPDAAPPARAGVGADQILRALTQLLIEKGVLTRDELVARLSEVARQGGESGGGRGAGA
jgi:hypothetical protein